MTPVAFIVLVFLADVALGKKVCSYQDIVDYLNLTTDNSAYKLTRPILDHTHPTTVELDILLYTILAVMEKTQTFIPVIWATTMWNNERISWDPAQFCGITQISLPIDLLWKPDLFIYEMVQKDESPVNPYLLVSHDGRVLLEQDMRVVSICKMDVHKFPFDTQQCTISFSSSMHCIDELRLTPFSNSSRATQFSLEMMKSQGEWEFLHLSVASHNLSYTNRQWDQLIYTFTMKRRPLLHVINFLLPILFFLCLDLASHFISDQRGEKLGFKVTVLLAISVLLLILNEILPSMSNKTPLIATYCIVIFALMLLSLLETILVNYLVEKWSQDIVLSKGDRDNEDKSPSDSSDPEKKRQLSCSCTCKRLESEKQHELLPVVDEVNSSFQVGESGVLLLILEELKEVQTTLNLHLGGKDVGGRYVQWAQTINKTFFTFYIVTVLLFLTFIFIEWTK